jgi:hypothetical protein
LLSKFPKQNKKNDAERTYSRGTPACPVPAEPMPIINILLDFGHLAGDAEFSL